MMYQELKIDRIIFTTCFKKSGKLIQHWTYYPRNSFHFDDFFGLNLKIKNLYIMEGSLYQYHKIIVNSQSKSVDATTYLPTQYI